MMPVCCTSGHICPYYLDGCSMGKACTQVDHGCDPHPQSEPGHTGMHEAALMCQLACDAAPACEGASKAAHQHPVHHRPEALPQRRIAPRMHAPCCESRGRTLPVQGSECFVLTPPQPCTAATSDLFTVVWDFVCRRASPARLCPGGLVLESRQEGCDLLTVYVLGRGGSHRAPALRWTPWNQAAKLSLWRFCHLVTRVVSDRARNSALRCAQPAQHCRAIHVRPLSLAAMTGFSRRQSSALRTAWVRQDCQALDNMLFCRRATALRTVCFAEAAQAACWRHAVHAAASLEVRILATATCRYHLPDKP